MPAFFPFEARFPINFGDACETLIQRVQLPLNPHKGSDPLAAEAATQEAVQAFQQMLEEGIWGQKPEQPLLVGYQCQFRGHTQRGLIGLCDATEVGTTILPHENIRQDRALDIQRWQNMLHCQWTPVYLSYRFNADLNHALTNIWSQTNYHHYVMKDGARIDLWPIQSPAVVENLLRCVQKLPLLYIADGHHRAGACQKLEIQDGIRPMLSVLVSDRDLRVYPFYRRILNDQSPLPFWDILDQLKSLFRLKPCSLEQMFYQYLPAGHFLLVHREACWILQPLHPVDPQIPDVQWLQEQVLGPICGIGDPGSDPRLDFGSMNIPLDAFRSILYQAQTEFILVPRAPSPEEVFRTADRGEIMPPKSTSFEPKIPSGLVAFLPNN